MNTLKNKVQLIGNAGSAPEIKNLENNQKMARFSLATNESYRNQSGEKVQETEWHTLIAFGKVAELCEKYISKGSEVAIEGKLSHRDYTDSNGVKRYVTEVQINELLFLDRKTSVE